MLFRSPHSIQRIPISEELLRNHLDNQAKELEISVIKIEAEREIQLKERGIRHEEILAQTEQAKLLAEYQTKALSAGNHALKVRAVFFGAVILFLLTFSGYALSIDRGEIVIETVKVLGTAVVSAFGGYQYGARRAEKGGE